MSDYATVLVTSLLLVPQRAHRQHCHEQLFCWPFGRGITLANAMHLAMRCLSNMFRSHSSFGISVCCKLLAIARGDILPF